MQKKQEGQQPTNVILISIDTLRADHLGCYGYDANTSPNIDSFAKKNILFENCFVHEPHTLSSHMSMLSGLYPVTHGLRANNALATSIMTLPQVLKQQGFETLGVVVKCTWLNEKYGFARGFDTYIEEDFNAEYQNQVIEKQLKKLKGNGFFAFLHYYDVHSDWSKLPYDSPEPYNKMFYPNYEGGFTGGNGKVSASKYLKHVNKLKVKIKEDDLKYINALYDGGIAYTDNHIGRLFEMLKKMDIYDSSLIIITSDHGEEFQEHGLTLHANPFYHEELVHVPLIVKLPYSGGNPKTINNLVETVDITPTILDLLKTQNAPVMQGDSLLKIIDDPNALWKDHVFGFSSYDRYRAFVRGRQWKMVTSNIHSKNGFKMFDLLSDPKEKSNLADKDKEMEAKLKTKLLKTYAQLKKQDLSKKVTLTPEEIKRLKSLGYLQ